MTYRFEVLKNFLRFYAGVGCYLDRKLCELICLRASSQSMPLLHAARWNWNFRRNLKNLARVSHSPRNSLAVQVFQ